MEVAFWISLLGIIYAYFGYPLMLTIIAMGKRTEGPGLLFETDEAPPISLVIPAHNESDVIGQKIENSLSLYYPGKFQLVIVSDGSTDETSRIVASHGADQEITFVDLQERKGKANALNVGVESASGEIIVFSDASIILEKSAIWEIVRPFADSNVGCVSGEDRIDDGGGEGLYGKYELFLRRQESALGSIVGASGSIYAQRRKLIADFPEGMAPDFLSVLHTVASGFRAISTPRAVGYMTAIADSKNEFRRKVRTVIRGMTALFQSKLEVRPRIFSLFSYFLFSHKLMRWCVPLFLVAILVSNLFLLDDGIYRLFMGGQLTFYIMAFIAYLNERIAARVPLTRIALYFVISNAAILLAWVKYLLGVRQEIWGPSRRTQ